MKAALTILGIAASVAATSPTEAFAQAPLNQEPLVVQAMPRTKFDQIPQPLDELLNEGYKIRAGQNPVFLEKDIGGGKTAWATCYLDAANALLQGLAMTPSNPGWHVHTNCFALN